MTDYNGSYSSSAAQEPETLYCANHPTVPTYLRCGRCGKPICAKCRVATPVGYRCMECANLSVLPTYAIQNTQYARAAVAGVAVATVVGLLWGLLPGYEFWAALIMGIGVGEAVSWAVNMKRGPGLQIVGLAAVAWGIIFSRSALLFLSGIIPNLMGSVPGNYSSFEFNLISRISFIDIWQVTTGNVTSIVFLVMALGLTFVRLR